MTQAIVIITMPILELLFGCFRLLVLHYFTIKFEIILEANVESSVSPLPNGHNENILKNYRIMRQPGNWHWHHLSISFKCQRYHTYSSVCVCGDVLFLYWSLATVPLGIIVCWLVKIPERPRVAPSKWPQVQVKRNISKIVSGLAVWNQLANHTSYSALTLSAPRFSD